MHCKFLTETQSLYGHNLRTLEITCPNGFVGIIYTTKDEAFEKPLGDVMLRVWHYSISDDGKRITLTGVGRNSVDFASVIPNSCHETITDWPLES